MSFLRNLNTHKATFLTEQYGKDTWVFVITRGIACCDNPIAAVCRDMDLNVVVQAQLMLNIKGR